MCKIIKVLNNMTATVSDNIEIPRNAKFYLMQKMSSIINDIEAIYIEIAGEVLKYAEEKYWDVSDDMLIPLALVLFFFG
ncbi:MAG: hypothetical protein LUG46_08285 [Erysipelotrichaceae bacterium]|nr:hypothetical protein [Erysipelotrichaceae bacterium]